MERADKPKTIPSNNTPNPACQTASPFTPPNPYARDPSRRAIACVTCAKAKTRCDKALPSCSRCITKGLKCDPRSTRRTSDNTYRTLLSKKPFLPQKRYTTPGILPSTSPFPQPRTATRNNNNNNPPSRPCSIMRAPSHIDFRTAVKMSQQAALLSSVPKLTPLPTYHSQIVDESYDLTATPEPELRYTPEIEDECGFSFSRGATPQTPQEGFSRADGAALDHLGYLECEAWEAGGLVPVGLGLGFSDVDVDMGMGMDLDLDLDLDLDMPLPLPMSMSMPTPPGSETWPPSDPTNTPTPHTSYLPNPPTLYAPPVPIDWSAFPPHASQPQISPLDCAAAESKIIDPSLDSTSTPTFDSGIVMQAEWTPEAQGVQSIQPVQSVQAVQSVRQDLFIDMSSMVTSAPYVPKMQGTLSASQPVWEDVFMAGVGRY